MAIYNEYASVRGTAGTNLTEAEGCFVTAAADETLTLATATTKAAAVLGVLTDVGEAGTPCDVELPGSQRLVGVRLHSSSPRPALGAPLYLAANGTVTATAGKTKVAVCAGFPTLVKGNMVRARLCEPADIA